MLQHSARRTERQERRRKATEAVQRILSSLEAGRRAGVQQVLRGLEAWVSLMAEAAKAGMGLMPPYAPERLLLLADGMTNAEDGGDPDDDGDAEAMEYEIDASYEPMTDEMSEEDDHVADAKQTNEAQGEDAMEVEDDTEKQVGDDGGQWVKDGAEKQVEDDGEQGVNSAAVAGTSEPVTAVASSPVQVSPGLPMQKAPLQSPVQDEELTTGIDAYVVAGAADADDPVVAVTPADSDHDRALETASSAQDSTLPAAPRAEAEDVGEVKGDDLQAPASEMSPQSERPPEAEQPLGLRNFVDPKPLDLEASPDEEEKEGPVQAREQASPTKGGAEPQLEKTSTDQQNGFQLVEDASASGENTSKGISSPVTPRAGHEDLQTPETAPGNPRDREDSISATPPNQDSDMRLKKATPKKRRAASVSGSSDEDKIQPRRSKRVKREVFPHSKPFAGDAEMAQFEMLPLPDSERTSAIFLKMRCKHCQREILRSRATAKSHLKVCQNAEEKAPARVKNQSAQAATALSDSARRQATWSSGRRIAPPDRKPARSQQGTDAECEQLVWLMGSQEDVDQLQACFQKAPLVTHAPISRFQELMQDDNAGLRGLRIKKLLEAGSHGEGPVALMLPHEPRRRRTGEQPVDSLRNAEMLDSLGFALRFPAPSRVTERFAMPLAKAVGLAYARHQHTSSIVSCPQPRIVLLDWQFHRSDMLVFQLRGRALWKTKVNPVKAPLRCFHPHSRRLEDAEEQVKVNRLTTLEKQALVSLAPPFDERHAFEIDDDGSDLDDMGLALGDALEPGSVIYIPRGMWFEAEVLDERSLWLEVQLAGSTYEELAFSALRQLVWHEEDWRATFLAPQNGPTGGDHGKRSRRHMGKLLKELGAKLEKLKPSDLLPDYLVSDALGGMNLESTERDTSSTAAVTQVEVDLTKSNFKPKHVKIFKDATYRVNPVAMLLSVDEVPHAPTEPDDPPAVSASAVAASTTKPRALNKKPKRKLRMTTFSQQKTHEYLLHVAFGNDGFRSQLRVKFRCLDAQATMVEWLRARGAEPFHADDLWRNSQVGLPPHQGAGRSEETARQLLRFLLCLGYVSHVNLPTKRRPDGA